MVDIPIGLPDCGQRDCDMLARQILQAPRSSSVFSAPVRSALGAASYAEACELGVKADGRKLSKQTWNIVPKIVQVDNLLRSDPSLQSWIREVHPEVCFWAWNGKQSMAHGKKSSSGKSQRESLVVAVYGSEYAAAQAALPRGKYKDDDLLDAFSALWTAERFHARRHMTLPDQPPIDSCGLRMEIIA
jgi:predicted RNase H-like nuclease